MADGTPRRPSAVSGPGALSRRTDGGPGSSRQPVRVASGGAYGERQAAVAQQGAAPMASGGPAGPAGGRGAASAPPPSAGAFGPSQRPNEPNDAMMPTGPQMADSPDAVLREMYRLFPSQHLSRLIGTMSQTGDEPAPPSAVTGDQ